MRRRHLKLWPRVQQKSLHPFGDNPASPSSRRAPPRDGGAGVIRSYRGCAKDGRHAVHGVTTKFSRTFLLAPVQPPCDQRQREGGERQGRHRKIKGQPGKPTQLFPQFLTFGFGPSLSIARFHEQCHQSGNLYYSVADARFLALMQVPRLPDKPANSRNVAGAGR